MVCINCGGETRVTNSRHQKRSNSIWRRRHCQACNTVFTSIEAADLAGCVVVRKPKGLIEPFSRDKLLLSVYDSLKHRKTALDDAVGVSGTIISKLLTKIDQASIDTLVIKEVTYSVLKRFDRVAAVHYAAYHPLAK